MIWPRKHLNMTNFVGLTGGYSAFTCQNLISSKMKEEQMENAVLQQLPQLFQMLNKEITQEFLEHFRCISSKFPKISENFNPRSEQWFPV